MGFYIDDVRLTLNCKITYFKKSGKMYTETDWCPSVRVINDHGVLRADFSDAISTLKGHLRQGQRPGLVDCPFHQSSFMVELRPHDGESHGFPIMVHIPIDIWAGPDNVSGRG